MAENVEVPIVRESKPAYVFIWGVATGFIAAALLTPIAIFSTLAATEPSDVETARAAISRPEACQLFYASGGAAAEVFIDRMGAGLKTGQYDADALTLLLSRVDNGASAALTTPGLERSSFDAYRDLARDGERLAFDLVASNETVSVDSLNDFTTHWKEVQNLCNPGVE